MKVVSKVNGLRSLAGALGVAALALGLSLKLEGAPTVSKPEAAKNMVVAGAAQETTKAVEGAAPRAPTVVTNESASRLTAGSIPEGGMPVIATIHVDWRDDEGTRLRQAGKLVGPMPSMVQEGAVAAAGGCSFSINCDDANPCTIDTCNIAAGGPLGAGKCEYNPVPDGFNLAAFGCSDDDFCNGFESCKNLVCHGGDNNTLPCTTNTDCPGGLCYGACANGTAPSCCADRDGCNEPFAVCDEDSDNPGDRCESDAACRGGGRCNRCKALCASDADCDDERRCTGTETCVSKVCYGGVPPIPNNGCSTDAECPDIAPGTCPVANPQVCVGGVTPGAACTEDANCPGSEGLCLGTCKRGVNPCGSDARCNEGYCFGGVNDPPGSRSITCTSDAGCPGGECVRTKCSGPPNPNACKAASDCAANQTCNEVSPVCYLGRCCTTAAEPACSKVSLAACPGNWYASDGGEHITDADDLCGGSDPNDLTGDAWGCPKYSSGFTQTTAGPAPVYPVKVGPVSDSLMCVKSPGGFGGTCTNPFDPAGRFHQIGDDYSFDNSGYLGLDVVRFVLDVATVSRLSMDVYDDAGNFVEDMNVLFDQNLPAGEGIVILVLRDPMIIPGKGWIVLRTSERFLPNSRFQWFSTTSASGIAGTNDPDALWINSYPGLAASVDNNFLKMCDAGLRQYQSCVSAGDCPGGACVEAPGILAFELAGDKPAPGSLPVGACCVSAAGTCMDGLEPWVCQGQRKCSNAPGTSCTTDMDCGGGTCLTNIYHGDGSLCERCNGGTRAGQSCSNDPVCPPTRKCVGGSNPNTPCTEGGSECLDGGTCTAQGVCTTGKVGEACSLGDNAACDEVGVCSLETVVCINPHAPGCTNTTCGQANCCSQVCAFDPECNLAGTCSPVECKAIAACGSGACCGPDAPYCEVAPDEATCEAQAGHTWLGYGTDCDADNGRDAAQQHGCPIPNYPDLRCMSGPNNNQTCTSNGADSNGDGIGDADCRKCVGGGRNGLSCTTTSDPTTGCLDPGTCNLGTLLCEGGTRDGLACANEAECPDDPGVCRGRCVSRNTGGDNCMDAVIQVITVPSLSEGPKTYTFTGTNVNATRTTDEPENCPLNASDPGWWEGFSIDKCARVRLDFCESDPIREPSWGALVATCNPDGSCDDFLFSEPDPFTPGQRDGSRGSPWCVEDNVWETYGPLEAGTYWKPVYADLAGAHGEYQWHVTVQACPTAACCKPDDTCEVLTEGACEAAGGFILAPPNVGQVIPTCVDPVCVGGNNAGLPCVDNTDCDPPNGTCVGTCVTGSCCRGAGDCVDQDQNERMTEALCNTLDPQATFLGGVRCKGGTCACGTDVGKSCGANSDCSGGPTCAPNNTPICSGTAAQLAQQLPCPICPYSGAAQCTAEGGIYVWLSDSSSVTNPTRQCNDIMPTETAELNSICVLGHYIQFPPPNFTRTDDCEDLNGGVTDEFTVRLYAPDPDRYFPGALLGEWIAEHAPNPRNPVLWRNVPNWGTTKFYDFQLTLTGTTQYPLVELQAGQIYFLEVTNNTVGTNPAAAYCNFYMYDSGPGAGNDYAFLDGCGTTYTEDSVKLFVADPDAMRDPTWCMNVPFVAPPTPTRACCTGDPIVPCVENSIRECAEIAGDWQFDQDSCLGYICPVERNDVCARAPFVREGEYEFNMYGLTLDGSPAEQCVSCTITAPIQCATATTNMASDLWFFYQPSAAGRVYIGTCDCERGANEVVSVYHDPSNPTICPCPGEGNMGLVECADGAQANHIDELGCRFGGAADVDINVDSGKCYTVRVANFKSAAGTPSTPGRANLRIALAPAKCGNGIREPSTGTEPRPGEQCDPGNPDAEPPILPSDSLCPGECAYNCLCPPPVCGDSVLDANLGEECDGTAPNGTTPCNPNACRGPGDPDGECTCIPFCGNNRRQGSEICDGTDDEACGGANCRVDGSCRCEANCGNGIVEVGEACDPGGDGNPAAEPADALCKTRCVPKRCSGNDLPCTGTGQGTCPSGQTCDTKSDSCTCPPAFCGNNYTEELGNNEECDGTDLAGEGRCPPDECRPPGDPAGECTCGCAVAVPPTNILVWRPTGRCTLTPFGPCTVDADCPTGTCKLWPNDDNEATTRALRFRVVAGEGGPGPSKVEAIRVTMVDLQRPDPRNLPQFPPKDYSTFDTGTARRCTGATTTPNFNGHHCASNADCLGNNGTITTDDGTCAAAGPACTGEGAATNANQNQGSCTRWVGRPWTFYEAQGPPLSGPYRASRLQCTPVYWDWKAETDGLVTVVGAEIVPSSEYSVQIYGATCIGAEKDCENVSAPVSMFTRRKGDLDLPFQSPAPAALTQADVLDISQAVASVKHVGPAHYRGQMQPNLPELNSDANVLDIVEAVDSVKRTAYSFSGPCACPSTQTCGASCTGCAGLCLRKCVGGSYDGQTCINNTHCPGGGYCNKKCVGGTNDNGPCSGAADCPGAPAGVCTDVAGTCYDKCGRCN